MRNNVSLTVVDQSTVHRRTSRNTTIRVLGLAVVAMAVLATGCSPLDDDDGSDPTATPEKVFVIATVTPQQSPTPRTTGVEYVVQEGDTISGIAEMFGVSQDEIARANNLTNLDTIHAGQVLQIPPPDVATPER